MPGVVTTGGGVDCDAVAGGGGDGCGGSDEPDEGPGTDGDGTEGSGVGSELPGVGDWGTGGWVSVTVIAVPGTVTVLPGIVTVLPGTVTVLPGTVTVVPGLVTVCVTVKMVLLPPFPPGVLSDTEARPGLDGNTVVVVGGAVDVSVTVT